MSQSGVTGTRRISLLAGALNTLRAVLIPVATLIVVFSAVWLIENDPNLPWLVAFRTALDFWFASHGVALEVKAQTIVSIASPHFRFSIAPVGLLLVVIWLGRRTGKKLLGSDEYWPGWVGAVLVYLTASIVMLPLASSATVYPDANQAVIFPTGLFAVSMIAQCLFGAMPRTAVSIPEARERLAVQAFLEQRRERAHWFLASVTSPAFKAGTGVVVALLGISSVMLALSLVFNWVSVTRLYEGLQVSAIGGIAVTLLQLIYLPNLVVYGASWLTGAGFAIGIGSNISPLGSQVGPMPALPFFGALPVGTNIPGLVVVVVPVLLALIATVLVKNHTRELRFHFASPIMAAISLGLAIGAVAAVEAGLLSFMVTGSLGPDRMTHVGVNSALLALVVFAEVAPVSILAAFYSARPDQAAEVPSYLKR